MAINGIKGGGRVGAIKDRVQALNPKTKHWVKINTETNLIINQKANKEPFKGVRKV